MKIKPRFLFLVCTLLLAQSAGAVHQPARCISSKDSLEAHEAIERREWAIKCFPTQRGPIYYNKQMMNLEGVLSEGYPTLLFVDDAGMVSNPSNWFAPKDRNAQCNFPAGYVIVGYCAAGCYTPEQVLLFDNGYRSIAEAKHEDIKSIRTLSADSSMDSLDFITSPIDYFITDLVEGKHDILFFQMKSGGELRVTTNHPIVDSKGRMRSADTLKIGESLVLLTGEFDPITKITPEEHYGRVYNLEVKGNNLLEKVVVAQGYLNGSVYYQNEGLKDLNRMIFRANVIPNKLVQ